MTDQIEMPPAFQQLKSEIAEDRKRLLKTKAFEDPAQLRQFVAQFLYPRLAQIVDLFAEGLVDNYNLSVNNANQAQRLMEWAQRAFAGAGIDAGDELPGVDTELLSELGQAFYALQTILVAKLPEDQEVQSAFNSCAELLGRLTAQLMGVGEDDEDEDEDEEEDEEEDSASKSSSDKDGGGSDED